MAYVIQSIYGLYEGNEMKYVDVVGEYLSKMESEGWALQQVIPDHRDYSAQTETKGGLITPGPMAGAMLVLHKPDELV